jgi:hypothetical protein
MTRKDFELVARVIAKEPNPSHRAKLACDFADAFKGAYENFDAGKFHERVNALAEERVAKLRAWFDETNAHASRVSARLRAWSEVEA